MDTAPEHFTNELYCYDNDVEEGEEQRWECAGLATHSLEIARIEDKSLELDQAMEDLRQRYASSHEEKEAGRYVLLYVLPPRVAPRVARHGAWVALASLNSHSASLNVLLRPPNHPSSADSPNGNFAQITNRGLAGPLFPRQSYLQHREARSINLDICEHLLLLA